LAIASIFGLDASTGELLKNPCHVIGHLSVDRLVVAQKRSHFDDTFSMPFGVDRE